MNSLTFLKYKLTKKSNSLTKHCDNTCGHCNNLECEKMKKCQSCNKRAVCKICYYQGQILCKECDDLYLKQMENLVIKSKVHGCDHCGNHKDLKSKKCDDCSQRKICSECYYDKEEVLCNCCSIKYNKWADKVDIEMNKKEIYSFPEESHEEYYSLL